MDVDNDKDHSTPPKPDKNLALESQTKNENGKDVNKMVEINMFNKEGDPEEEDGNGSESANEDEDQAADENEDEDKKTDEKNDTILELRNFTSQDLDEKSWQDLCNLFFKAFKNCQRDHLVGMDISDEMEKKSPKFDLNCESELRKSSTKYFDRKSDNPKSCELERLELENIFAEIEFNTLKHLPWQLGLYRSCLSSRHFFPADIIYQLMIKIRDVEAAEKSQKLKHQVLRLMHIGRYLDLI